MTIHDVLFFIQSLSIFEFRGETWAQSFPTCSHDRWRRSYVFLLHMYIAESFNFLTTVILATQIPIEPSAKNSKTAHSWIHKFKLKNIFLAQMSCEFLCRTRSLWRRLFRTTSPAITYRRFDFSTLNFNKYSKLIMKKRKTGLTQTIKNFESVQLF